MLGRNDWISAVNGRPFFANAASTNPPIFCLQRFFSMVNSMDTRSDRYQQPINDRRSCSDRRKPLFSLYHGEERRGDTERRAVKARRLGTLLHKRKQDSNPKPFHLFIKKLSQISRYHTSTGSKTDSGANAVLGRHTPRNHQRIDCDVPAQVLERDTQHFLPATVRNHSKCGMYLVSDNLPIVGSGIAILMVNHSPQSAEPDDTLLYHSQVIWHRDLSGHGNHARYGFGVKHCQNLEEFLRLF
jgi:hypothetical protein